jgi:hypothetical protein
MFGGHGKAKRWRGWCGVYYVGRIVGVSGEE